MNKGKSVATGTMIDMATIKLIVTGVMEEKALAQSLKRIFPGERLNDEGKLEPVEWAKPRKLNCATSHRLAALSGDAKPGTPMLALAQAMLDEAMIGPKPHGKPADLVLVVDDVELGNWGQEQIVAQHFRAAVELKLLATPSYATQARYRSALRQKCSLHLLKPMVESYLFGDAAALIRAGVAAGTQVRLKHETDVEQFESNDQKWMQTCHQENLRRQSDKPWWRHERHPKHYLEHLAARHAIFYEESAHGKQALLELDWCNLAQLASDAPFMRAMLEDIADWFGVPVPIAVAGQANSHFYPAKAVNRQTLLLRNL
jgi:hypothetical protein